MSGRPQVLLMLERLIGPLLAHRGVRFVTMAEVADDFLARSGEPSGGSDLPDG